MLHSSYNINIVRPSAVQIQKSYCTSECSINKKSYYTSEYSILSKIILYVRVQYKIKNRTVRPSIVQNQKSYCTSKYSTKSKIVLYVRVQYILKNPHCTSECNVFFKNPHCTSEFNVFPKIRIVRTSAMYS